MTLPPMALTVGCSVQLAASSLHSRKSMTGSTAVHPACTREWRHLFSSAAANWAKVRHAAVLKGIATHLAVAPIHVDAL